MAQSLFATAEETDNLFLFACFQIDTGVRVIDVASIFVLNC